jgi:hypothetical protein
MGSVNSASNVRRESVASMGSVNSVSSIRSAKTLASIYW